MNKVIKLYADWCGPCKAYAPVFEAATANIEGWEVVSLDIGSDEGREVSMTHEVKSIPTTIFIREGVEPLVKQGTLSAEELRGLLHG